MAGRKITIELDLSCSHCNEKHPLNDPKKMEGQLAEFFQRKVEEEAFDEIVGCHSYKAVACVNWVKVQK